MSETINKSSQNLKKDQPTDENVDSQAKSGDDVTWADLENTKPAEKSSTAPQEYAGTEEILSCFDYDDKEGLTQQE